MNSAMVGVAGAHIVPPPTLTAARLRLERKRLELRAITNVALSENEWQALLRQATESARASHGHPEGVLDQYIRRAMETGEMPTCV